ncbi:NAD(P)-dependent dehydrogenase (short-subunit alcohol dehydrogenase family) [Streptomyces sp. LBL]|uniref:SDR family NAD(P)-dependent oxidoreductase n=1 Tax=Streptomyces sp. LBL TaxID=2940562 RepID=UPI002475A88F|nr:SDR family NAD(P)-dependent oxidoreductase [Streptomyces sp. LBL]MDH6622726.1 NAD(P)-dependent dehydrogenase (short-subunit alcohol dehydrogenase family) [Streptomyces sp. LBL]
MSKGSALIVGVGPGLGLALAEAFARDGNPVALFGRCAESLETYAAGLSAEGHTANAYQVDATDPEGLRAALVQAADDLGAPEVLVYNAALMAPDTPTELDAQDFARTLAVNVTGAMVAARTVLPLLPGGRGSLLFTGGGLALDPSAEYASLSVGKAALRAYVQSLCKQQQGSDVHVTTVTVTGYIGGGDPRFTPEALAAAYLDLHQQPQGWWQAELLYT